MVTNESITYYQQDRDKTMNKTQSYDQIYKNNIGDREKMFLSGIVNNSIVQNGTETVKMVRQPSYSEFGILNYENGIFKKKCTDSKLSNNSCADSVSSKNLNTGNSVLNDQNNVINKTLSDGNIYNENDFGNREKIFINGITNNGYGAQENANNNQSIIRQPSYNEFGILYDVNGIFNKPNTHSTNTVMNTNSNETLQARQIEETMLNETKTLHKTQSCCNMLYSHNIGDREKIFLSGVINNSNTITETPNRQFIRQPSYVDNGILNYDSQTYKNKASTKIPSDILNNTDSIYKSTPREMIRQPSYADVGILNYEPQLRKAQTPISSVVTDGNFKQDDTVQKKEEIIDKENGNLIQTNSCNKTQSCGNVFLRSNIGDRENCFINGIMNNNHEIPGYDIIPRTLVRQPSYTEVGILNYSPQIIRKPYSVPNSNDVPNSNECRAIEKVSENFTSDVKILTKAQSCGSILSKSHIGNQEKMFVNGIMQHANSENLKPVHKKARQPLYSEIGILNYPNVTRRRIPIMASKEGNINEDAAENDNFTNEDKILGKAQSCGSILSKSQMGNRETMFVNGVMNASSENLKPVQEFVRPPSYSEVGILNYDSQLFKRQSSFYSISSDDTGNVLEALKGEFSSQKSPKTSTTGSISSVDEDMTSRSVESPARSRIIARVKKSRSFALLQDSTKELPTVPAVCTSERQVLVIYTGGTIGMVKNSNGVLEPIKGAFEGTARMFPQLHDNAYWCKRFVYDDEEKDNLVLPVVQDLDARIIYKILESETLIDSANITAEDWISIARIIKMKYDLYDGFVILHGTDTLAYTASALSFMLENIGKPVVITGSQIPIFEPRSDGADNFVSALIVAGGLNIPEVTVMFGSNLLRGNRTSKISAHNFDAFNSANFAPLVEFGIDIQVNTKAIFRPTKIEKMHLHEKMCKNVGILRIFPSISPSVLKAFFQPPIEGVVLETYGSGNIPSNCDIFTEIEAAVKRGVIVVNITQCASGSVSAPVYETGRLIHACGVISGYDMTSETALAKLAYVLSKDEWSHQQKIEAMTTNIRGELTNLNSITIEDNSLIDALASSLKITSPKQLIEVTDKVFAALLLYAIDKEEEVTIQTIQELGAEVNSQNSEGKTPLHEAINKENVNIVKYLLLRGANVHLKTKSGESPLLAAIQCDQHAIIKLLLNCGAHLTSSDSQVVVELLSLAARKGSLQRLQSLKLAGADFDLRDEMRQTALHKAVLSNQPDAVSYLLVNGAQKKVFDVLNVSPLEYAWRMDNKEMIGLLE